jgi:L-iditol 2-dehydrogenase
MLTNYKHLELVHVPEPEYGPEDLLVSVRACGICGSDIHGYEGSSGRRIPPLIMGHEAAGVVTAVGKEVSRFKVGDRVTFDSTVWCGKCHFCRRGQINLCDNRNVLGVSCGDYRRHGAFAEFVSVPQHIAYPLPEKLSFEQAAMIEAVSIAVHAVNRTPIKLGETATVVGSGMIGLLVVQSLKLAGCSRIIAIDLNEQRLELSRRLGATDTFLASSGDAAEYVKMLTEGRGADVTLEVVGGTPTVRSAIECTRKGGTVTLVGNLAPRVELPLQLVVTRELNVLGSCASQGEIPQCIELLNKGDIRVESMITARAPLEDGPKWFERLHHGEPNAMKVLLCPNI